MWLILDRIESWPKIPNNKNKNKKNNNNNNNKCSQPANEEFSLFLDPR